MIEKYNLRRNRVSRFFEIATYVSLLTQWLWVVILFMPAILRIDYIRDLPLREPAPIEPIVFPFGIEAILVALIVVAMLGLSGFFVAKVPAKSVKISAQAISTTVDQLVLPAVERHTARKRTPKQRRILRKELMTGSLILLAILPIGFTSLAIGLHDALPDEIAYILTYSGAVLSLILISIHWLISWAYKIS